MLFGFPLKFTLATLNHHSNIYRALVVNPGSAIVHDDKTVYARELEVPSGGGVGTARAIAKAYGEFASGGKHIGLTAKTLDELAKPAVPSANGFYDECMLADAAFSLGFAKPSRMMDFPNESVFGHPGAGGSLGFADPMNKIGYAYVTNRMGTELQGDPREVALRNAVYQALATAPTQHQTLSASA
jgi:CubicO group peptidase (beta-lactamase class C family)